MVRRRTALLCAGLLVATALVPAFGERPRRAVVTAAGTPVPLAYVISKNGQVQVLDTAAGKVRTEVDTGAWITGAAVAPDGTRVYVVNGYAGVITAVDPLVGKVTGRIHTGAQLARAALHPNGERLYVTGSGVVVVDTRDLHLIAAVRVGRQPQGIAVAPDGDLVFVANSQDGTVTVMDTKLSSAVATIPVGGLPQNVAVSPDGSAVYVSSLEVSDRTGTITLIDPQTNRVRRHQKVGRGAGSVAVTPDGERVYVALDGEIAVLDTSTDEVTRVRHDVRGLAIPPGDRRVFLACGKTTTVMDSTDNTVLTTYHHSAPFNDNGRRFDAIAVVFAQQRS
ncbi:hypothetical protein [Saccharothrix sp.]|uniref:hypothetical protein n=1 Tax=Saccharothrix sp. TaxID=1873460 RepID=UPI002810BFA6|nr:hypothetical protein [Saccharothrix sp.]